MTRLALVASLGLASLAGCHASGKASLPEAGTAARAVRVAKPTTRLETGLARATGPVRAREEAVLASKVTGQVKRVRVSVGDRVKAGQPLVELDGAMAAISVENGRAAVRLADANLAGAELELKRAKMLAAEGAIAQAMLDRAQTGRDLAAAQLDQARAGLHMAEQQLSDTVLTAPFDGVITGRFKNPGDFVSAMPLTSLVAVSGVDHLEARLAVPEGVEPFVQVGQPVVAITSPGGLKVTGKVRVKNAAVDAASRTVEVLVDLDPSAGATVRPGTIVNVDFGGFGDKDGLYLPATAVRGDDKGASVLVVADGKAALRAIQFTQVNPGVVAVRGGLDASSAVILDPGGLAVGDAVVPLAD